MIAGRGRPSVPSTEPPYRPWSDSTRPMPASSVQGIWQAGWVRAIVRAAVLYARSAADGTSKLPSSLIFQRSRALGAQPRAAVAQGPDHRRAGDPLDEHDLLPPR